MVIKREQLNVGVKMTPTVLNIFVFLSINSNLFMPSIDTMMIVTLYTHRLDMRKRSYLGIERK